MASKPVVPGTNAFHQARTLVMGIVNVTPDSFYDGGAFLEPTKAIQHAHRLAEEGADILDIGGESSRPGAEPLSSPEEKKRVLPVLEKVVELGVPISVDTYHADTAAAALARGASMINDITALRGDAEMASVIASHDCECVLMHMQGNPKTMQVEPRYKDVVDDICAFFEERLSSAIRSGIKEEKIWLDPGFGFGKTVEHNLTLLRRLSEFRRFGRPILIGTSNKTTIGKVLGGLPVEDRLEGTAATVAIAIWNGADAVRVHNVKAMGRVARMCDAILGKVRYE